jgi:hypothetical protein
MVGAHGRNARATTIELMICFIFCAGCAAPAAESQGLEGNVRPTSAISAIPRKPAATPRKPAAAPAAAATRKATESAEQLLTSAVAADVTSDDDHVAIAVEDLSNGQFASCGGHQEFDRKQRQ